MSIRQHPRALEGRAKLRAKRSLPAKCKALLLEGCTHQSAYIQFQIDLGVHGLWEALLLAEGEGFTAGTIQAAFEAALPNPRPTV